MLNPATGRWMQEDPIRTAAGDANIYRYVGNNPVNATDPSGLEVVVVPEHAVVIAQDLIKSGITYNFVSLPSGRTLVDIRMNDEPTKRDLADLLKKAGITTAAWRTEFRDSALSDKTHSLIQDGGILRTLKEGLERGDQLVIDEYRKRITPLRDRIQKERRKLVAEAKELNEKISKVTDIKIANALETGYKAIAANQAHLTTIEQMIQRMQEALSEYGRWKVIEWKIREGKVPEQHQGRFDSALGAGVAAKSQMDRLEDDIKAALKRYGLP